jgi:hypothetical protein
MTTVFIQEPKILLEEVQSRRVNAIVNVRSIF